MHTTAERSSEWKETWMRKVIVHIWMSLDGSHSHPAPHRRTPPAALRTAAGTCATSTTPPGNGWSTATPRRAASWSALHLREPGGLLAERLRGGAGQSRCAAAASRSPTAFKRDQRIRAVSCKCRRSTGSSRRSDSAARRYIANGSRRSPATRATGALAAGRGQRAEPARRSDLVACGLPRSPAAGPLRRPMELAAPDR